MTQPKHKAQPADSGTAQHHPSPEQLLEVAAGVATPAGAMLTASHMVMCPRCRAEVARLEEDLAALVFGDSASLHEVEPSGPQGAEQPLREAGRKLKGLRLLRRHLPKRLLSDAERRRLPSPLLEALHAHSDLAWRPFLPGVERITLDGLERVGANQPLSGNERRVALLNLAPGLKLFQHRHQAPELTLVLSGAYRDQTGRYATGDVATMDAGSAHAIEIETHEPCIALVVQDALLQPCDRRGRLARRVTRLLQATTGELSPF